MSAARHSWTRRLAASLAVLLLFGMAEATPQYRAKLKVADFSLYSSLENFPLLVRLSESRVDGFKYADCAANGADISFTLPDGTLLPHEVDTWNTSGDSFVWVSLPTFRNGSTLYVRWKDSAPPTIDPTQVWSRANYVGVWHLNESSGDAVDSSGSGYTGTVCGSKSNSCVTCESALGRGRQMGSTSSATGANSIYLKFATVPQATMASTFSISFWAKVGTNSGQCWFANKDALTDNGFSAVGNGFYNTAEFNVAGDGSSTSKCLTRTSTLVNGIWSPFELFWNGTSVNVRCGTSGQGRTTTMTPAQDGFAIGSSMNGSLQAFRGQADEIRLRTVVPTDDWRTAEEEQVKKSEFVVADSAVESLGDCILVSSSGAEFAAEESPAYGRQEASVGTSYTFTAPASATAQGGAVTATCTGWSLQRISDGAVVRTSESPAAGEGTTTCIVDYAEPVELRWNWSVSIGEGRITYYVSRSGNDADGLSWATAFRNPQSAIDAASGTAESPATILVADGTYPALTDGHVHTVLNIAKSHVSVRSVNGPDVTFLDGLLTPAAASDGQYAYRAVSIGYNLTDVFVGGFGIRKGYKDDSQTYTGWNSATSLAAGSGILSNLAIVVANRDRNYSVYLDGTATLVDSDVTTVASPTVTGWFDRSVCYLVTVTGSALVDRCVVHDVPSYRLASGSMTTQVSVNPVAVLSANAVLRNSLVTGCVNGGTTYSMPNGATVYASAGTIENCTITGNKTYNAAGGLSINGSVVCRNNVIYGNETIGGEHGDIDIADGTTPSISYTCSSDVTTDVDHNINGNPSLNEDCTLPIDSLVAGAGDATLEWLADSVDLAGNPRLWTDGTVSPGAYEPQGRARKVYVDFSYTNDLAYGNAPFTVGFKATVSGTEGAVSYEWNFGDGTTSSEASPDHEYVNAGCFDVTLTVKESGKDPVSVSKSKFVTSVGCACYVRADHAGVKPYDTWDKATSNIDDAVALRPARIIVTNGTYRLSSVYGLNLTWPVTVCSVEGPEKTILDTGSRTAAGNGDQSTLRNVTLANAAAVVDGFGLVYGKNTAILATGGEIRNCHFWHYLGSHKLISVSATDTKISGCTFDFSHISCHDGNAQNYACAIALSGSSLLDRCVVSNYYCAIGSVGTDWKVSGNAAVRLGGCSAIRNSYITGNTYSLDAAGANAGVMTVGSSNEVANCTIVANVSENTKGGTMPAGGGLYVSGTGARIANNVIWTNTVSSVSHDVDVSSAATGLVFSNNLLANEAELPSAASACVTGKDPLFLDDGAGYRISRDSPCYNAGRVLDWCRRRSQAKDFDGQERRRNRPDIGCFEVQREMGLVLLVK